MRNTIAAAAISLLAGVAAAADPCEGASKPFRVVESGNRNGPVLVLLHGISSSLDTCDGWAERLTDYRVIRIDLPGSAARRGQLTTIRASMLMSARFRASSTSAASRAIRSRETGAAAVAWLLAADRARVERLILISPDRLQHSASRSKDV